MTAGSLHVRRDIVIEDAEWLARTGEMPEVAARRIGYADWMGMRRSLERWHEKAPTACPAHPGDTDATCLCAEVAIGQRAAALVDDFQAIADARGVKAEWGVATAR